MKVQIDSIIISERARGDFGDLEGLARSMMKLGQLQAIGIDSDNRLIFGERRIRAAKSIGWTEIDAVVIDCDSLQAEHDENELRKQFTVTERLAIAQRIAERMGVRQGQRNDLDANAAKSEKGKTADIAARQAGLGSAETLARAKKVVANGTPELVAAMDEGKVSIHAAAKIAELPQEDQRIDYDDKQQVKMARESASKTAKMTIVIEYSNVDEGAHEMAISIIRRDEKFASALLSALLEEIGG